MWQGEPIRLVRPAKAQRAYAVKEVGVHPAFEEMRRCGGTHRVRLACAVARARQVPAFGAFRRLRAHAGTSGPNGRAGLPRVRPCARQQMPAPGMFREQDGPDPM